MDNLIYLPMLPLIPPVMCLLQIPVIIVFRNLRILVLLLKNGVMKAQAMHNLIYLWVLQLLPSRNVFVADTGNNRIQEFTNIGTFIKKWGKEGSSNGKFLGPWGIEVDSSGNVFVADTSNHRIQKFTDTGMFIRKWGSFGSGNGEFRFPSHVAVDSSGNVFVADFGNDRIQKFTNTGQFIRKWGSLGRTSIDVTSASPPDQKLIAGFASPFG